MRLCGNRSTWRFLIVSGSVEIPAGEKVGWDPPVSEVDSPRYVVAFSSEAQKPRGSYIGTTASSPPQTGHAPWARSSGDAAAPVATSAKLHLRQVLRNFFGPTGGSRWKNLVAPPFPFPP